jgi:hypothetical protein
MSWFVQVEHSAYRADDVLQRGDCAHTGVAGLAGQVREQNSDGVHPILSPAPSSSSHFTPAPVCPSCSFPASRLTATWLASCPGFASALNCASALNVFNGIARYARGMSSGFAFGTYDHVSHTCTWACMSGSSVRRGSRDSALPHWFKTRLGITWALDLESTLLKFPQPAIGTTTNGLPLVHRSE